MQRRTILSALLGSALVTRHALTGTAWAQEAAWPTKAIKMIVPFAPGGAADAGARLIENIGGAGGKVGIRQVARARRRLHHWLWPRRHTGTGAADLPQPRLRSVEGSHTAGPNRER